MAKKAPRLTSARRKVLDRLLVRYLELPGDAQPGFLAECRSRYPRLSRWLESLIAESHTISFLDDSVRHLAEDVLSRPEEVVGSLQPGQQLGPWRIIEEVGRGGMGRVYRGERADGAFEMDVAIKLIARRHAGLGEMLRRECRLLARLDHPAITRLMDAGIDDAAGPFLVMEWIEGTDLAEWLEEEQPDTRTRLELFERIAEALAHAHQRLIVHGDIKPANIHVDTEGRVKLLDFGVARLMAEEGSKAPSMTALTPAFAAPEQLEGAEATVQSDVWALGTLLHWLLTGQTPERAQDQNLDLTPDLSGLQNRELPAIVKRACAHAPAARYSTVQELASDLRALRTHRTVAAMPHTAGYRMRKFCRRNKLAVTATAAIVTVLIAGLIGSTYLYLEAEAEAERVRAATERTVAVKDFLAEMISAADVFVNPGQTLTVRDVLDQSRESIADEFADQPDIAAELLGVVGASYIGLGENLEAREVLEQAMAIVEAGTIPRLAPRTVAEIHHAYAHSLRDPDSAARVVRNALDEIEGQGGLEEVRSGLLGTLAATEWFAGNPDEAVRIGKQAAQLVCEDRARFTRDCIIRLADLKYFLVGADELDDALTHARTAYELAERHYRENPHPVLIRAGLAYGEELTRSGRPLQAIEMLNELRDQTEAIYGADNINNAYLLYRLAHAHAMAGEHHIGWQLQQEALDQVAELDPGNRGIGVQLNVLVGMLLELRRPDAAETAIERYADVMSEHIPHHAQVQREINELRLTAMQTQTDERWMEKMREMAGELLEADPPVAQQILRRGLIDAIEKNDEELAAYWIDQLTENGLALDPQNPIAKAQFHLVYGDLARAESLSQKAIELLEGRQEQTGPRLAEARAVRAEVHCRQDALEEGLDYLDLAVSYWRETVKIPSGEQAMHYIARTCTRLVDRHAEDEAGQQHSSL